MVDSLRDKIPEILHTPEGAYAAMKILWNSNAKDRKVLFQNEFVINYFPVNRQEFQRLIRESCC